MRWPLALVLCLVVAGCGSDDKKGSSSTVAPAPTQTKADGAHAKYIAEADALCKRVNAEGKRLNSKASAAVAAAKDDTAAALKALTPILREGLDKRRGARREFRAIRPPAADRAAVNKYLAASDAQAALLSKVVDAAAAGDRTLVAKLSAQQGTLAARTATLARTVGFKECGSGSATAG